MDLNGQKCPACGRNFDHDDDIVVCPVCGTPQHRACWDERGECVNASRRDTTRSVPVTITINEKRKGN